jgi:predicted nucleotide-binding protein (sugar kinase/HSP70/actin superfamily)
MKASNAKTTPIPTWPSWPTTWRFAGGRRRDSVSNLRVGLPKALSLWSTHRFWLGLLLHLGVKPRNIVLSSDTSEAQLRNYAKGRVAVETCFPAKCLSGHVGQLLLGQRRPLDLILCPMIYSLPCFDARKVQDTLTCSRDMGAVESMKSSFLDEGGREDARLLTPFVSLGEPAIAERQLAEALAEPFGVRRRDVVRAARVGFRCLREFDRDMRDRSLEILRRCARRGAPCIGVLGRPYHMDPGIGHRIVDALQREGYPLLWNQYFPDDEALLRWLFAPDLEAGFVSDPLDISDVWPASFSNNTNDILWGAKFAARCPWISCVLRLSSYECGMDQPTYTPVQRIVETSGTLFFKFGDLDATKPSGSVTIRTETVLHYLSERSEAIISKKLARLSPESPLA